MNPQTLSDDQKLLAIHIVIQVFIKPSNDYYRNAVTKIQRFWRKRNQAIMDLNLWLNVKLQILSAIDILHMVRQG